MNREPLGRDAYRAWRRVETRWADNDQYGHVNNTVYYQWFDTAVNGWLIDHGLLRLGAAQDVIALVAETGCTFFEPVSYPRNVEVGLVAERVGSTSVTYAIGIFAEGADRPAAQGHFVHVCVHPDTRRPAPLPETWRGKLGGLAGKR